MVQNFEDANAKLPELTLKPQNGDQNGRPIDLLVLTSLLPRKRAKVILVRYGWLKTWYASKLTSMHAGTSQFPCSQTAMRMGILQDAGAAQGYENIVASLDLTKAYELVTHASVQEAAAGLGKQKHVHT
eukprot:241227-Amphidinium_carterae.1